MTLRERLESYLPDLVRLHRSGELYRHIGGDIAGGVTVAVIALPLAMALAIASGVTPERGLFTAIVAGFVISALGGTRICIGGPTGAFVTIVFGIIAVHGLNGLMTATLMAGVILIIMGVSGIGALIKYIPYPVTTGFTAGIAVVIASTQVKDFLGLEMTKVPADFLEKWSAYLGALGTWSPAALGIGVGSLALLVFFRAKFPRIPGAIVAVTLSALVAKIFDLGVPTIESVFGGIPRGLPAPSLAIPSWETVRALVPEATTIALLSAIESLLCAVVADGMTGDRHNPNSELIAQGAGNIASVIFGGIPATGAIARTTANVKSGGKTPLSGMLHAVVILLVLLVAAPLAGSIPLASLAAILFVVAWNMAEIERFRSLFRAPKSDIVVLLTTFLLTILIDLTVAVQIGFVLAALLFIKRMSEVTNIEKIADRRGGTLSAETRSRVPPDVEIYEINGPFFFGVVDRLMDAMAGSAANPRAFILHMANVSAIDASGIHALESAVEKCHRRRIRIILTGLHAQPLFAIRKYDLDARIGEENLLGDVDEALRSIEKAWSPVSGGTAG